jgi:hypothetical protein
VILDERLRPMLDEFIYYGFPFVLLLLFVWFIRRQTAVTALYRNGQELQRAGQELVRESIRLQTEANQLMRELTEALRRQR